ncbi:MAG: [ribosomal protein S5]-alanine N-acetyltransferase [Methyloprofundus sp.]|nr:MAG: [ribosomal protein S5]-alanine N-acetyltransferase [Methyloprofundus sp.]
MSTGDKELIIRAADSSDLQAILEIQMNAFEVYTNLIAAEQIPPLNESLAEVQIDFKRKSILVASRGGKIVGSVRYQINLGVCVFERLSVDPMYQQQGIGQQLVRKVEGLAVLQAHKIYLETGLLAAELIKFYSGLGYSGEAVLKNHYGNFDWIVFSKFFESKADV